MNIFKKISIGLMFSFLIILPLSLSAQNNLSNNPTSGNQLSNNPTSGNSTAIGVRITNPFNCGGSSGDCTILTLITAILNNIVMPIASVGIVLFIIYAGFKFVIAQGNEKKVTEAKQMLLWGLIGAGVLLGAAGISKVIENTVNKLIVP